ncbi:MAG: DnaB-like helicase C-terminal domain-containing protein [Nitrososphaerota archaeon]
MAIGKGGNQQIEVERIFLSGVVHYPGALARLDLEENDFTYLPHQVLWRHIVALGGGLNLASLYHALIESGDFARCFEDEGAYRDFLNAFAGGEEAKLLSWALWLRRRRVMRDMGLWAREVMKATESGDDDTAWEKMWSLVGGLNQIVGLTKGREQNLGEALEELLQRLRARSEGAGRRVMMGFPCADRALHGFEGGNIVVLQAPSGKGKSMLALLMGLHNAKRGIPVYIFGLEMEAWEYGERVVTMDGGIDPGRLRAGRLLESEWQIFQEKMGEWKGLPLYFCNVPMSIPRMEQQMRSAMMRLGVGLFIVDYVQLVPHVSEEGKRYRSIAEVVEFLKRMSMELGVPVLVVSQENQEGETRESRDIFNVAHVVLRWSEDKGRYVLEVRKSRAVPVSKERRRIVFHWQGTEFKELGYEGQAVEEEEEEGLEIEGEWGEDEEEEENWGYA